MKDVNEGSRLLGMEQDEEFTNSPKHKLRKIFRTQFLVIN